MFGPWGQALEFLADQHNAQRREQTRAYRCILSLQRLRVEHSLGTTALQEGRPEVFAVEAVMGRISGPPALTWSMELRKEPNAFWGNLPHCSTVKLKQQGDSFLTYSHLFP